MKFDSLEISGQAEKTDAVKRKDDALAKKKIAKVIDFKQLRKMIKTELFSRQETLEDLSRLVFELGDKITDYDTILSDDASGRLVSRLLWEISSTERKKIAKKTANGYFIAGGQPIKRDNDKAITAFLEKNKQKLGKTLLVTEYIESGKSIMSLIKLLENEGIDFDVATVSIHFPPQEYNRRLSKRLYYGSEGPSGEFLYGHPLFAGVRKLRPIAGEPVTRHESAHPYAHKDWTEEGLVQEAREDIKVLSSELSKLSSSGFDSTRETQ